MTWAAKNDEKESVKMLIDLGADVNQMNKVSH